MATTKEDINRTMTRGDVLTRLICLFEDYTIRRCWPQMIESSSTLTIVPTLIFNMSGEKTQAIRITPGSNGPPLVELSKFEKVYLATSMPSSIQDEIDCSMYQKGRHWLLCARAEIPTLRQNGHRCIENIWNAPLDQFPDLLWGMIRWQIKQEDFQQLWFVVSSDDKRQRLKSALDVLTQSRPKAAEKLQLAQIALYTDSIRGFSFLNNPQLPPKEGEQMLLLYEQENYADLFQWSRGKFIYHRIVAEQNVDLALISRLAICSDVLDRPPEGTLLFHTIKDLDNYALAHYVLWQPVLRQWEVKRKRQHVQQLQYRIAQLKSENQDLKAVVQRAKYILAQVNARLPLDIGDTVCLHSESTSAPQQP